LSEFAPDVGKHIHLQIVVIQRIINHVERAGPDSAKRYLLASVYVESTYVHVSFR
jgi:hypothetical protein